MLWPWLGASARRTLRGITVRKTLSPKCLVQLGRDRVGEVVAHVEHGAHDAFDLELRIEPALRASMVSVQRGRPSSAKYSHCIGTSTPSAAVSAFSVSS
jgi:hypothetical protein